MAAGKICQMSSPVVYSLSQTSAIQKEDECIFPTPDCLCVKGRCSLPISAMMGLDYYNRSMMFWLLDEFMETEQGRCSSTHEFPAR